MAFLKSINGVPKHLSVNVFRTTENLLNHTKNGTPLYLTEIMFKITTKHF
jgi:hypothetical protein